MWRVSGGPTTIRHTNSTHAKGDRQHSRMSRYTLCVTSGSSLLGRRCFGRRRYNIIETANRQRKKVSSIHREIDFSGAGDANNGNKDRRREIRGAGRGTASRQLTLVVSTWAFSPSLAGRRRPSRGRRRPSPDVRCSRLASLLLLSSGRVSLSKILGSALSLFYQYTYCSMSLLLSRGLYGLDRVLCIVLGKYFK